MKNKIIKVYLAGKIEPNGWRQNLVNIRDSFSGNEKDKIRYGKELKYNDNVYITGPFFLACDHSCYHGDNSHGLGLNGLNDCYGLSDNFSEDEVKDICLSQIRESDIVFAYINDNTCYGTLYELGYANALNKPIYLLFDNSKLRNDMWFIGQGARIARIKNKYTGIKENFDNMILDYQNDNLKNE